MNIYNYDEKTKEYLSTTIAEADPEETKLKGKFVPLIPENATLIDLPEYGENEIPVFKNENWVVQPDYRKNFYKVDDNLSVQEIKTIGDQEGYYIVDKTTGDLIKQNSDKYKIVDNQIIAKTDEEYQAELEKQERTRIMNLSLTKADVLLALYEDKGLSPDDIKAMLKDNIPALIKFDYASSYYRGDEVVNTLGLALGYTTEEMDYLFENKTFPPKQGEESGNEQDSAQTTE